MALVRARDIASRNNLLYSREMRRAAHIPNIQFRGEITRVTEEGSRNSWKCYRLDGFTVARYGISLRMKVFRMNNATFNAYLMKNIAKEAGMLNFAPWLRK